MKSLTPMFVTPLTRINSVAGLILLAVNVAALAAIHLFWPGVRFESGVLNYAVFIALHLSLPLLLVLLAFSTPNKNFRIAAFILASIAALPTGFLSFAAFGQLSAALRSEIDPSLQPVAELKHNNFTYRLYRTNHNPYKAHGLLLRKEQALTPGIKLVSDIKGFYGTKDGELQVLAAERAQVITKPFSPQFKVEVFEFAL